MSTEDTEAMAREMASVSFNAALDDLGDLTKDEADRLYDECLAEAFRILIDAKYACEKYGIPMLH